MKLSIIIPFYNVELYIESCLLSVLNQVEINDTEIILIDDCGTDNSKNIVQRIVQEYSNTHNIKIISHTHNQGLSAARNTGVKYAKGDYIFFLDSDDKLPNNTIKTFLYYFKKYKRADFYIGNYIAEGNFNGPILDTTKGILETNKDIFNAYINGNWYPMAWGKFINRDFFIKNELWFPIKRLHEDEYFSFLLALKAKTMVVMRDSVYIYNIRENSITTSKKRKNFIDYFWIITQNNMLIRSYNLPMSSSLYNYITSILWGQILTISLSQLKKQEKIILASWCTKELKLFTKRNYTLKSLIKTLLISMPMKFRKFN